MTMLQILIVEDEKAISELIRLNLTHAGYKCSCAFDGMTAADMIQENYFDLILLDIMLPYADGYELMDYIRPMEIPVIFITAKSAVKDKVKGLLSGAEDYITKPFEIVELLARVEVVLRRYHKSLESLFYEDIVISIQQHEVRKGDNIISLTPKEFDLLLLLVRNKNISLFRNRILESVWGEDSDPDTRTLDLHIQRLRKKLQLGDKLRAVYKVGYRLEG